MTKGSRTFLFLQGPHGPFFRRLAAALARGGHRCLKVGFTGGDRAEWRFLPGYIPFRDRPEAWPAALAALVAREAVTDIVLYGDERPLHVAARATAARLGLTVHCFEEGYLRPYWITYERGGVNGNSRLLGIPLEAMAAATGQGRDLPAAPAHWGDALAHAFAGLVHHLCVLAFARAYPQYRGHRGTSLAAEFRGHLLQLLTRPVRALRARAAIRRLIGTGSVYHVVLLQLAHDSSMRHHSAFRTVSAFVAYVLEAFAEGAPAHHVLVFKTHPFDDGREPVLQVIRHFAGMLGLSDRVRVVQGGKLGPLLDAARSVVTVNSTAGQQALWRGLPVSVHGTCVYDRPGIVARQPLAGFFAAPEPPDAATYRLFRRFLLETSQIRGGFYTRRARAEALRVVVDAMLDARDPYDRVLRRPAATGNVVPFPGRRDRAAS